MGLNKEQEMASSHRDGPMLVLAGPGSGKTHTLVSRILNLVEREKIPPETILVITFSKKAAIEMQARFNREVLEKNYPVTFGTFHAIFYNILKQTGSYSKDSILTPKKQIEYIERIAANHNIHEAQSEDFVNEMLSKISKIKSISEDYKCVISSFEMDADTKNNLQLIYEDYERILSEEGLIDFDDMILKTYELFSTSRSILTKWQEKYKYILVDEFQDINELQYETLMLLAGKNKNIFAVGDDDQAIYGFRGSNPDIMKRFSNMEGCKIVNLVRNYRCSEQIINNAEHLISKNDFRIKKSQLSEKEDKSDGFVRILKNKTMEEEADLVILEVKRYIANGVRPSDIAILYRTNKCANIMEEKLIMEMLPYNKSEIKGGFYDSTWATDIISFLEIASGNNNRSHFLRVINRVYKSIPREIFKKEYIDIQDIKNCVIRYAGLEKFIQDIEMIGKLRPYAVINYIFKGIGYEKYMKDVKELYGITDNYIEEFFDELLLRSKEFNSTGQWIKYIYELKKKKNMENSSKEGIVLQTAHASKGLQYDVVFIIGLKEGLFPHNRAVFPKELEEERRLLYVAMTRAKRYLYLCGLGEKENGKQISRFIIELESSLNAK